MGIPKLHRYISQRWPLISQPVDDSTIAEFDNFYLDMNSILHNATHGNAGVTHHVTEKEMFRNIFNYIEHLVDLIRPQKHLYMAIDGVAPRAKMNQQRSRRFRSALDAEIERETAIRKGIALPKEDPFDKSAITPGTEFMLRLSEHLKYFVHRKITEDTNWQNITVILSGPEVPGEGEHKIMHEIRMLRSSPGYSANTRHCLYGSDADLIMLGLATHEPHFAILRERVLFGQKRGVKPVSAASEQIFDLLHISLVREYLEIEFSGISMDFEYDFERIIDDFIMLNFFIGNDFLPELPLLLIVDGALPHVINSYKAAVKKMDGYITNEGYIDFSRLTVWLDEISKLELKAFESEAVDLEWVDEDPAAGDASAQHTSLKLLPSQKKLLAEIKPLIFQLSSADHPKREKLSIPSRDLSTLDLEFLRALAFKCNMKVIVDGEESNQYHLTHIDYNYDEESIARLPIYDRLGVKTDHQDTDTSSDLYDTKVDEDPEDQEELLFSISKTVKNYEAAPVVQDEELKKIKNLQLSKFDKWRAKHYRENFDFSDNNLDQKVMDVSENYLEGLQWVLLYYYRGCASWDWFYAYHYAPCISDVSKGLCRKTSFEFELGKPARPLAQLMSVLPDRSRDLVPVAFRELMTSELSPIKDYYPRDFKVKKHARKADWEAVVEIPFVDTKKLLRCLESKDSLLSPEEKSRDKLGLDLRFYHDPQQTGLYHSPSPEVFPSLMVNHCSMRELASDVGSQNKLIFGLLPGARLGSDLMAGYPSLKTLDWTSSLEFTGKVKVFESPTRWPSIQLSLLPSNVQKITKGSNPESLVGQNLFVLWPYLTEARVESVSDGTCRTDRFQTHHLNAAEIKEYNDLVRDLQAAYATRAIDVGETSHLIYVSKVEGMTYDKFGALKKKFSDQHSPFLLQTLVKDVKCVDERLQEKPAVPVKEEFPLSTRAIFLHASAYGRPVVIVGHFGDNRHVDIEVFHTEQPEPSLGHRLYSTQRSRESYNNPRQVSSATSLSSYFISKITSKYLVEVKGKRVNIGLQLKFQSRKLKVLGYTRSSINGWLYSSKALELIVQFIRKFPSLKKLQTTDGAVPNLATALNISEDNALALSTDINDWLKEQHSKLSLVPLDCESLDPDLIRKLELGIIDFSSKPVEGAVIRYKRCPKEFLLPAKNVTRRLQNQKFYIGDRVVSVVDSGKVAMYHRGTVIAFAATPTEDTRRLRVLFDCEFDAAHNLDGLLQTRRCLEVSRDTLVNLSQRQLAPVNGTPGPCQPVIPQNRRASDVKKQPQPRVPKPNGNVLRPTASKVHQTRPPIVVQNSNNPKNPWTIPKQTSSTKSRQPLPSFTSQPKSDQPVHTTNDQMNAELMSYVKGMSWNPATRASETQTEHRPATKPCFDADRATAEIMAALKLDQPGGDTKGEKAEGKPEKTRNGRGRGGARGARGAKRGGSKAPKREQQAGESLAQ